MFNVMQHNTENDKNAYELRHGQQVGFTANRSLCSCVGEWMVEGMFLEMFA